MPDTPAKKAAMKRRRLVSLILTGLSIAVLLYFELAKPVFTEDTVLQQLYTMVATRGIGALVFFSIIITLGYRVMNPIRKPFGKALLFCIPAFLVVVNNAPILSTLWGNAYLVHTGWRYMMWFILECLCIGLFEEAAFRGVVLLMVAEKRRGSRKDLFVSIILSSAVFGAIHLVNIFTGANPGAVILQIGYSFLIGAMCSVVLFKTANIWLCVALHAIYDFCGHLMPTLGTGSWWDTPTVVITVILAVFTVVFYVAALWRIDPIELDRLYPQKAVSRE